MALLRKTAERQREVGDEMYDALSKRYRAYVATHAKPDEPHGGERFWHHGHRPGPPRGSGGWHRPEGREGAVPPPG